MEHSISGILEFLHKNNGCNHSAYHIEMLERRIKNRIVNTKTNNPPNYYKLLTTDPEEPSRLIENFMINVSHFFRDPLCFELLAKTIIPNLVSAAGFIPFGHCDDHYQVGAQQDQRRRSCSSNRRSYDQKLKVL